MRLIRDWRFLALTLALASTAHGFVTSAGAQEPESITGHVSAGGLPVQGATVRIRELGIGTTTNAEGRFTFIVRSSNVRGQTVTLEARHVRYNPVSVGIALTGGTLTKDFELFPIGDSRGTTVQPVEAADRRWANERRSPLSGPRSTAPRSTSWRDPPTS